MTTTSIAKQIRTHLVRSNIFLLLPQPTPIDIKMPRTSAGNHMKMQASMTSHVNWLYSYSEKKGNIYNLEFNVSLKILYIF